MLFDLLVRFILTPENVWGFIWSIVTTVCMCLIFRTWQEKWWKSLIPFYGTYLIYKNTWKQLKWLFLVELLFSLLFTKCGSYIKKQVTYNLFYLSKTFMETGKLDVDVSIEELLAYMVLLLISVLVVTILKRVTYVKICSSLSIHNSFLKIGTFLFPEIFLIIDHAVFAKKQADLKNGSNKTL